MNFLCVLTGWNVVEDKRTVTSEGGDHCRVKDPRSKVKLKNKY